MGLSFWTNSAPSCDPSGRHGDKVCNHSRKFKDTYLIFLAIISWSEATKPQIEKSLSLGLPNFLMFHFVRKLYSSCTQATCPTAHALTWLRTPCASGACSTRKSQSSNINSTNTSAAASWDIRSVQGNIQFNSKLTSCFSTREKFIHFKTSRIRSVSRI